MITIKIQGGLGNQMFQYALGKVLSINYNTDLIIDNTFINNRFPQKIYTFRPYELNIFGINNNFNKLTKISNKLKFLHYIIHPLFWKIIYKFIYGKKYIQDNLKYNNNFLDKCYLDGYWQSYLYFDKYKYEIQDTFTIKTEVSKKNKNIIDLIEKNYNKSVSVHIRRGDYVTNKNASKWHGVCDINYYNKANKNIKEKIKNPYFFVFSDDIEWVKQNIDFGKNVYFVDNNIGKGYEDLRLMYSCANHVIANSSFSWWGAYLGRNKNKIIIAPKKWLLIDDYNYSDILPDNWIKI